GRGRSQPGNERAFGRRLSNRSKRPRHCCDTQKGDELAASHGEHVSFLLALCRCRKPPCGHGRTAEQRDEFATLHSITSSARARSVGGTSMPSALAVLRLTTSSNLGGACTGRSAGGGFLQQNLPAALIRSFDPFSAPRSAGLPVRP